MVVCQISITIAFLPSLLARPSPLMGMEFQYYIFLGGLHIFYGKGQGCFSKRVGGSGIPNSLGVIYFFLWCRERCFPVGASLKGKSALRTCLFSYHWARLVLEGAQESSFLDVRNRGWCKTFKNSYLLTERMKLLVQDMEKKYQALTYAQMGISKTEVDLAEVNHVLQQVEYFQPSVPISQK